MASTCVLLDDDARLVACTGEKTPGGGSMSYFVSFKSMTAEPIGCGRRWKKSLLDCGDEGNVRLVPDVPLKPPDIFTVSLHLPATPREILAQLQEVRVVSVVKNLIVLSTGLWLRDLPASGEYMVYNVSTNSLMLAPQVNWGKFRQIFITRRIIMHCTGSCDFRLIMLLRAHQTTKAFVLTWQSSSPSESSRCFRGQGQWKHTQVCLPKDIAQHPFAIDEAFYFADRWACWVDLHRGIIMCDMLSSSLDCRFVPTPEKFQVTGLPIPRGRPDVFSSMGVVKGEIKFLVMDGFDQDKVPRDQITIRTFTLSEMVDFTHGQSRWMENEEMTLRVGDLWNDESYLAIPGLPKCIPMCPVQSSKEPNMVYFSMNWTDIVEGSATKLEYALGVNLKTKKVQEWTKSPPERRCMSLASYIATEFPTYRQSSDEQGNQKRHKGEVI